MSQNTAASATELARNLPALEHPDGSRIRALVVDDEAPAGVEIVYTGAGVLHAPRVGAKDRQRVQEQFVASWEAMKASAASGRFPTTDSPV